MAGAGRNQLSRTRILWRGLHRQNFLPVGPVAILYPQGNWRPDRLPVPNSCKNFRGVLLDLLPSAPPIAKLPTPQLVIDELHVNR